MTIKPCKALPAIAAFLGPATFGNVSQVHAQQDQATIVFRTRCVLDTTTIVGRRHLDGNNRAERVVIAVTRDGKVRVNGNPVEISSTGENSSGRKHSFACRGIRLGAHVDQLAKLAELKNAGVTNLNCHRI